MCASYRFHPSSSERGHKILAGPRLQHHSKMTSVYRYRSFFESSATDHFTLRLVERSFTAVFSLFHSSVVQRKINS